MPAFTVERHDNGIAVLTFDLPGEKVNKLGTSVMDELDGLLDTLRTDRAVKALIIRSGKPGAFIAGADIAELRGITDRQRGEDLSRRGQALFRKIEDLPFPTVAAVHGACLGGGLELALACRRRVVSSDPKTILGLPEVTLGIIPAFGGTQRLPRLVGLTQGLDMIVTGRPVSAAQAGKIGLADEPVAPENLLAAAVETALREAAHDRPAGRSGCRPLLARFREHNPLARMLIFRRAERGIRAETRGNHPAPPAALDAVRTGLLRGIQAGFDRETALFGGLSASDVSKNLIHAHDLGAALKREGSSAPGALRRAGVIGGGALGGGIAQLFAESGMAVRLHDASREAVGAGLRAAADLFAERSARGVLDLAAAREGMQRIKGTVAWDGFSTVDVAVDAEVERMEVKQEALQQFESRAGENALFLSNTCSLSITELAAASRRPGQVAGLHFLEPLERAPLVEIVRGKQTAPGTVAAAASLVRRVGKLPVVVQDGPGLLVNRILMPFIGEAVLLLEEGGSIEGIDDALMQFGMPRGAFVLLDEIGIDVAAGVARAMQEGLGRRSPALPLFETLSGEGYLGKKNGRGFYRYMHGRRGGHEPVVHARIEKRPRASELTPEEVIDRTVLLMIKEAALCMEEGIIGRPDLLDAALVFGAGFPPFRGGLLRYADSLGAKRIVEKLTEYEQKLGDRFTPPRSLAEMARDDFITQVVGR
jgi:3-hydroxyacyl-CoA dehydrogenase / enoyl-CoA hydratase / 3-hydroxybutyryl-CoA epimerase